MSVFVCYNMSDRSLDSFGLKPTGNRNKCFQAILYESSYDRCLDGELFMNKNMHDSAKDYAKTSMLFIPTRTQFLQSLIRELLTITSPWLNWGSQGYTIFSEFLLLT